MIGSLQMIHHLPCFRHHLPRFHHQLPCFRHKLPCFRHHLPCYRQQLPCFRHHLPCFQHLLLCSCSDIQLLQLTDQASNLCLLRQNDKEQSPDEPEHLLPHQVSFPPENQSLPPPQMNSYAGRHANQHSLLQMKY